MGGAETLFRELNLSQTQAQKLVDFWSTQSIKSSDQALQSAKDMRAGWVEQIRSNPEFKGEFDASGKIRADSKVLTGVSRMLDSLGNQKLASDFRQALTLTGAGDHPAVFAVLAALSQHFAEGTPVQGKGPSAFGQGNQNSGRKSAAQEIYPNLS